MWLMVLQSIVSGLVVQKKILTSPMSQVGAAHATIQAIHPVTKVVYPVYTDLSSNGNVGAFSVIKGGEIIGPFADPYVAKDEASIGADCG